MKKVTCKDYVVNILHSESVSMVKIIRFIFEDRNNKRKGLFLDE